MSAAIHIDTAMHTAPVLMLLGSDGVGGIERRLSILAAGLAARGIQCEFVALTSSSAERGLLAAHNVQVLDADRGRSPWRSIRRWWRLRRRLSATPYRAVLAFGHHANALACVAAIGTGHRVVISEIVSPFTARRRWWNRTAMRVYRLADLLVVQTQRLADDLRRMSPMPDALAIIANPIHPEALSPPPTAQRSRVIVGLGRLVKHKRYHDLVEAFARVASRHPDWRVLIMGDGPERTRLMARVHELGLSDRITFPGWVAAPWAQLREASVLVHCADIEGFGNTLIEAQGTGCAVIASDCPYGPREILHDGLTGRLYPVGDLDALTQQLDEVLGNDALRHELALAGYAATAAYDVDGITDQWVDALQPRTR